MHILVLYQYLYDTVPGQRFRVEQWEPLLRQHGVQMSLAPFLSEELQQMLYKEGRTARKTQLLMGALARRLSLIRKVRDYDAVFIFREAALLGPPVFERMIHRAGVPMVFDFDDAIFESHAGSVNPLAKYVKNVGKTATICRLASHVFAGNEYLADYARRFNPNVTVIPTTIDTDKYTLSPAAEEATPAADEPSGVPVIGWSGSHSTVQYLDTLRPVFAKLATLEKFRLLVVGTDTYSVEGVETEARAWRSETEVADLRRMDVGLMPLPDDRWTRGKCGLKALQYMALGIPTICSPVGVNAEIIRDGENGFLAVTEDEWVAKLRELLRSAELRRRLGLAGRVTVENEYSAKTHAPRVYQVLEAVVRSSGARGGRESATRAGERAAAVGR